MKSCDFKQVLPLAIVYYVLLKIGLVESAARVDCPPQQVLHFNPETNKGTCCIPVALPKGFGFKSCARDGTNDTIELCPTKLYQWDDTTTESEATCVAEMQCLDVENTMIEKCEDHGQNCRKECVCNFPGGYCGTEYFTCIPFPGDCPRNDVQGDCSCRPPGLEPEKKSDKADSDPSNSITPVTSVSKLPLSPASGISDKKIEGVPNADVGIKNEEEKNNNDTKSQTKPEESLSIGSIIWLTIAVIIVVIGGPLFVYILRKDRYKRLWRKCKRENQDSAQPKPIQKVTPCKHNSSEDQNEEALSLQRQVTVPDEPVEQEIITLPILSQAPLQEANGAQTNLLEDPHFPTLGSSLFNSHDTNSTADQPDVSFGSGRDPTDVKVVYTCEKEERHDSGALEKSRLRHVRVEPSLASERDGEEGEQLL